MKRTQQAPALDTLGGAQPYAGNKREDAMKRLLITGAAGRLGSVLRPRLAPLADVVRLADRVDIADAGPNEEVVRCEMDDPVAVDAMVEGCDGIVHLGGRPNEGTWEQIRAPNIDGVVHLYEAARRFGSPRIVFASSNHATGFYRQDERIDNRALPRPDGYYGVSKVFGEMLARMYHDKFGIETACVRIGSVFPEPVNHRMLASWLSADDFAALIARVFDVPLLGCPVIYGMSDNATTWWDNAQVDWLGWQPRDTSEPWRAEIDRTQERPAPDAPDVVWQGGRFTALPIYREDE